VSQAAAGEALSQLYLIYDERDAAAAAPWVEFLFQRGLEVIRPVFEGDEAELREYHEENLRSCDGALILHGQANECWLRRKIRELKRARGWVEPAESGCGSPWCRRRPRRKESFQTREAIVIRQMMRFSADPWDLSSPLWLKGS